MPIFQIMPDNEFTLEGKENYRICTRESKASEAIHYLKSSNMYLHVFFKGTLYLYLIAISCTYNKQL